MRAYWLASAAVLAAARLARPAVHADPAQTDVRLDGVRTQRDLFARFASERDAASGEAFMRVPDLLRALALNTAGGGRVVAADGALLERMQALFELVDSNHDGRISWDEYAFFLRLMQSNVDELLVAFRMFDTDGSGTLDIDEFQTVLALNAGITPSKGAAGPAAAQQSSLVAKIFGNSKAISVEQFTAYVQALQREIQSVQFAQYAQADGTISMAQLGVLFLSHANLVRDHLPRLASLPRELAQQRVTLAQYLLVERMLASLDDVIVGLRFTSHVDTPNVVTAEVLQRTLERLYRAPVPLGLVQALIHMLDRRGQGYLTRTDLIACKVQRDRLGEAEDTESWLERTERFINCVRSEAR